MAFFAKFEHGNLLIDLKEIELDYSAQVEDQFSIQIEPNLILVLEKHEIERLIKFFGPFLEKNHGR